MLSLFRAKKPQKQAAQKELRPRSLRFDVLEERRLLALSMVGSPIDLGTVAGFPYPLPWHLGEGGHVCGDLTKVDFTKNPPKTVLNHAFYYNGRGRIRDVGTLSANVPDVHANDVNRGGRMVGYCGKDGNYSIPHQAFLYGSGGLTRIPPLGGARNEAWGINDKGQVTGNSSTTNGPTHAFRYDLADDMVYDLGGLSATYANTNGSAINNAGWVAGTASANTPNKPDHLFIHNGQEMLDRGFVSGYQILQVKDINDAGQVFGQLYKSGSQAHQRAFYYNGSVLKNIELLRANLLDTYAQAMNKSGKIVGHAYNSSNSKIDTRAFLYDGKKMHDIGALGSSDAWANDINDAGKIVGGSYAAGHPRMHAFIYSGGRMTDLNKLLPARSGWELQNAFAINNKLQIVGIGVHNGKNRAFLLTLKTSSKAQPGISSLEVASASTAVSPPTKAAVSDRAAGQGVLAAVECLIDNALANATGTPSESAIGRATQGFANLSDGTPPVFLQGKDIAENWGSLQSAISVKRGSKRTAGAALTATGDSDRSLEPTLTESASDAAIAEIFQDWPTARREAEGGLS